MVEDHQFHTETIAAAFPLWAQLPYEDKTARPADARALRVRFVRDVGAFLLRAPESPLVARARLAPRFLRAFGDRDYASHLFWCAGSVLYLTQLAQEVLGTAGFFAAASSRHAVG